MRNIKLLSIATTLALATSASAVTYEHYQLYKDPKVMGAGGANVANGGSFSSVFGNPAGLSRIPKEYGWEFQLANVAVSFNNNVTNIGDLADAADESESELAKEIEKYTGENFHIGVSAVPLSISKKLDTVAFGIGAVGSLSANIMPHQGFGSSGFVEVNTLAVGGVAGGVSKDIKDIKLGKYALNNIAVGVGAKYLKYGAMSKTFSAVDIADDDFELEDELEKGTSVVGDLGVIYDITPRISMGLSAMNIGGIGDKEEGYIPFTLNAGLAYTYRVKSTFFNQVRFSADYVDITGEYEDSSLIKRTRFGADLNIWDGWASSLNMQAGLYQGEYSAGMSLRLSIVEISFATYAEELGAYKGQDTDRRYMGSFGINW